MIINLSFIAEQAQLHQEEFRIFKNKVKSIPVSTFDQLAHPIVDEVAKAIDCKQCGNCCRHQEPGVTEDEIYRLAEIKKMEVADFRNQFIAEDVEHISFLCQQPCIFLQGNTCSIYLLRPNSCADFPGLHRPRLKWRLKQVEENYGICPIVYHVVEQLKQVV